MATFETEIRKLPATELYTLAMYLNESNYWKKLMEIVPDDENENVSLFSPNHYRMIEQAIHQQRRSGAEIFLSEWSTIGKYRPTCKLLLDLLVKLEFFKAADYLAVEVLKIDAPERPKQGPAAVIDISDEMLEKILKEQAALVTQSEDELTCSVNYVEEPLNLVVRTENIQADVEHSDLIEFSVDRSDMIKFSKTIDDIKYVPDQVSYMPKPGTESAADKYECAPENYDLQVVASENIPLCVNDNDEIYSNDNNTMETSTIERTMSSSSIDNFDTTTPTASESDIPIAVLKYSDRMNKNT
ncbi:protein Tube [Phymastichus coffea]|uniref:protein Tube n=1 Tax=Phymastichus coffea TaxID=108790 RepID=UPI00273C67B1|nr:protein Tube [Phymastichus coffea]